MHSVMFPGVSSEICTAGVCSELVRCLRSHTQAEKSPLMGSLMGMFSYSI